MVTVFSSGDAAGALEKVTGVSVMGDGFVYVRGLGERYSSTQLNGAYVPTTEPEKRVVPLDLFPTGMIENIKIAKPCSSSGVRRPDNQSVTCWRKDPWRSASAARRKLP